MTTRRTTIGNRVAGFAGSLAALAAGGLIAAPFMLILATPFIGGW
jgi:hypothetical protein